MWNTAAQDALKHTGIRYPLPAVEMTRIPETAVTATELAAMATEQAETATERAATETEPAATEAEMAALLREAPRPVFPNASVWIA